MSVSNNKDFLFEKHDRALPEKACTRCSGVVSSGGGVELGPERWICFGCWQSRLAKVQTAKRQRNGGRFLARGEVV